MLASAQVVLFIVVVVLNYLATSESAGAVRYTNSIVADTQATKNLIDSLIPVGKAIRRFTRLPSPRHALHVLVANLGSPQEALDAGCDLDWLPPELQWQKDEGENL